MKEYKIKQRRGIDDLQNVWAWRGNSQGDESKTNNTKIGLASDGWMSYHFASIDMNDQGAIYDEHLKRVKANVEYIRKLQEEGRFGEEYELTVKLKENPLFDNIFIPNKSLPLESHRMIFIDGK